jgi:Ca2+-binding RTX toxin-like protein
LSAYTYTGLAKVMDDTIKNDNLTGTTEPDSISGGNGNDTLSGGEGNVQTN